MSKRSGPQTTKRGRGGRNKTKAKSPSAGAADLHVQLLNSISEAVIATDLTGKILFWNAVAEKLYGWTWNQAVGRQIEDLVVTPDGRAAAAKIMEQLRRGKSWSGKFKVRRRNGTDFVAVVTNRPIRDRHGNLIGLIGVSHPEKPGTM